MSILLLTLFQPLTGETDGQGGFAIIALILMFLFAASMVGNGGRGRQVERERYEGAKVIGARVIDECEGELEVTASHMQHVTHELDLPYHSTVSIIERNNLYRVRFPIPQKRTPNRWKADVWYPDGSSRKADVSYSQTQYARDFVQAAAEQNGYTGKVAG